MLRKLLKYDMSAVWRVALTVSLASLFSGFVMGAAIAMMEVCMQAEDVINRFLTAVGAIAVTLSVITIFVSVITVSIFVYVRFYKNLFTDEGYLTFTLPVSRGKILASKTINGMIWSVYEVVLLAVSFIITVLSYGIISSIMLPDIGDIPTDIPLELPEIGGWFYGYLIIVALMIVCSLYFSVTTVQMCVTLGAVLAKKAKLIAMIGIYYLITMILQSVSQTILGAVVIFTGEDIASFLSSLPPEGIHMTIYVVLSVVLIIELALAILFHTITLKTLNNKLNLQ